MRKDIGEPDYVCFNASKAKVDNYKELGLNSETATVFMMIRFYICSARMIAFLSAPSLLFTSCNSYSSLPVSYTHLVDSPKNLQLLLLVLVHFPIFLSLIQLFFLY